MYGHCMRIAGCSPMASLLHAVALALFLTGSVSLVHASIVSYRATGSFTSSDFPSDIAVGDQFTIDFAFDDSVSDSNDNGTGQFAGALHHLEFRLLEGSTGQFPGGYLTKPSEIQTSDGFPDR